MRKCWGGGERIEVGASCAQIGKKIQRLFEDIVQVIVGNWVTDPGAPVAAQEYSVHTCTGNEVLLLWHIMPFHMFTLFFTSRDVK